MDGIPTSFYARHKAEVERRLDRFEQEEPSIRVVRLRPALTFKRESASEQRRLFAGPFFPSPLMRRAFIPFVPNSPGLRFQAVHSLDVGEAYRLAATGDVRGAFNIAADPVLDPPELARILAARLVGISPGTIRGSPRSRGGCAPSRPRPAGSISRSTPRSSTRAARARSSVGRQVSAAPTRCSR